MKNTTKREVGSQNVCIALQFGHSAAETPIAYQDEWKAINTDLGSSRFYEISDDTRYATQCRCKDLVFDRTDVIWDHTKYTDPGIAA